MKNYPCKVLGTAQQSWAAWEYLSLSILIIHKLPYSFSLTVCPGNKGVRQTCPQERGILGDGGGGREGPGLFRVVAVARVVFSDIKKLK